jgi:hypothetical protein
MEQRVLVERLAQQPGDAGAPEALQRRGLVEGRDEEDRERRAALSSAGESTSLRADANVATV